jgi:hypothetical protein
MEAVDREMAACSFKLAGKLQNARRSAHEAKAAKRAANAGAESFAYRVLGVSLLAVVGGILFALIAGH